ncbi:MAG: hypothetical protein WBD95_19430 [Xanthobacteraceae bacterium]
MAYTPRSARDGRRMRRAVETLGGETAPAMAAALVQIGAAFDDAAAINGFKMRVERLIALGPDHPVVRARYGARAAMMAGRSLDGAIAMVERWWRDERKAFQIASAFGRGTRLSLEILSEVRLILRLLHFKRMETEYDSVVAALCGVPFAAAAE